MNTQDDPKETAPDAQADPKKVRIVTTITPTVHEMVGLCAHRAGRSLAGWVRHAISEQISREIGNKPPLPRARKSYIYNSNRLSSSNPMDGHGMERGSSLESNRAPARGVHLPHGEMRYTCSACDIDGPNQIYRCSRGDCVWPPRPSISGADVGGISVNVKAVGDMTAEEARDTVYAETRAIARTMGIREPETGAGGLIWPAGPLESFSDSSRLKALSQATFAYPGVDHQAIIGRLHERLSANPDQKYTIQELARFFAEDQKKDETLISETAHARAVSMENLRQTYLDGPWQWDADHVPGGKSWSFVQWCSAVKRGEVTL